MVTDTILTVVGVVGTIQGLGKLLVGGLGGIASLGAEVFSGGTLTPVAAVSMAISLAVTAKNWYSRKGKSAEQTRMYWCT